MIDFPDFMPGYFAKILYNSQLGKGNLSKDVAETALKFAKDPEEIKKLK